MLILYRTNVNRRYLFLCLPKWNVFQDCHSLKANIKSLANELRRLAPCFVKTGHGVWVLCFMFIFTSIRIGTFNINTTFTFNRELVYPFRNTSSNEQTLEWTNGCTRYYDAEISSSPQSYLVTRCRHMARVYRDLKLQAKIIVKTWRWKNPGTAPFYIKVLRRGLVYRRSKSCPSP